MIIYVKDGSALKKLDLAPEQPIPTNTVWIDLYTPTAEVETLVERFLQLEIPTREEMHDIELSNNLYLENGAVYMNFKMVTQSESAEPESHAYTCILASERLITIRYTDPAPFRQSGITSGKITSTEHCGQTLFVNLMEHTIEYLADILERLGRDIDGTTRHIFRSSTMPSKGKPNYLDLLD